MRLDGSESAVFGLRCPRCGGVSFHVRATYRTKAGISRSRVCTQCGKPVTTIETMKRKPDGGKRRRLRYFSS